MTGQSWLPPHKDHDGDLCIQQPGYLRAIPGEYVRRCNYCRATFIAVIAVTDYVSARCGSEVLAVRWLSADRQEVA